MNKTSLATHLGIRYPIVQGPFGGGLSSVELTKTVSEYGALGSFGGQPYTAAEIVDICNAIRKVTGKPFNINLWVNDRDEALSSFDDAAYSKLTDIFKPYFDELGLPIPPKPGDLGPTFPDQVQAIFDARPAVFSFVYGIPAPDILDRCRSLGIKTVGNATTADEAVALESAGVDMVVATGFEAGGHRVSFLKTAEDSLTGVFSLVPQVVDRVSIPVIAAGGIADARGVRAAMALGASGVQVGTAFLATDQSGATKHHRDRLFSSDARDTTLTKVFTGRLARGLRNRLTEELRAKQNDMAPYPLQGRFMRALRAYPATGETDSPFQSHWAGQSSPLLKHRDASKLLGALVDGLT